MKLEFFKIHKTNTTASLVPHLNVAEDGVKKSVAFFIRGKYISSKTASNLYNRKNRSLPPRLPKSALDIIMKQEFPVGDIPCFVIDRGADIEIVVE